MIVICLNWLVEFEILRKMVIHTYLIHNPRNQEQIENKNEAGSLLTLAITSNYPLTEIGIDLKYLHGMDFLVIVDHV